MKQVCILLVIVMLLLSACGAPAKAPQGEASGQDEVTTESSLANYEIGEYLEQLYTTESRGFGNFFSPEEYVKLCTVISGMSAEPCYAVSKYAVFIHQTTATYNSKEEKYLLIDTDGNTIIDYGDNAWTVDMPNNFMRFGDLTFVKTNGNPAKYDILDQYGQIKNAVEYSKNLCPRYIGDLGDGYFLFAIVENIGRSNYNLFVLHPSGDCYEVIAPTGYWNADLTVDNSAEEITYNLDATVGQLKEGLFSICYSRYMTDSKKTCAFYCDTNGNLQINLSSDEVGFHITKLGAFSEGKAEIKFVGADGKNYTAVINKNGDLVGNPTSAD